MEVEAEVGLGTQFLEVEGCHEEVHVVDPDSVGFVGGHLGGDGVGEGLVYLDELAPEGLCFEAFVVVEGFEVVEEGDERAFVEDEVFLKLLLFVEDGVAFLCVADGLELV